jgi:hypothetical protein
MPDSKFWRELAERFEKLPPISVQWQYTSGRPGQHKYTNQEDSQIIRLKFERLARKAGAAIDLLGEKDPLDAWLDEIRKRDKDTRNRGPMLGPEVIDGAEVYLWLGTIPNAVKASECLCIELESIQSDVQRQDKSRAGGKEPPGIMGRATNPRPIHADSTKAVVKVNKKPLSVADWRAVEISFLSDERVQIRNGAKIETLNYHELGLADRRNGKPSLAWVTLRVLAQERGIIGKGATTGDMWSVVEKRMQEINKVLMRHFHIASYPITFVKGTGYQAHFKIACNRSYKT